MPQADGVGTLRRFVLQLDDGTWYRFQVNPANYSHTQGQRATVFKTKSNIIIEDFGEDLGVIAFSGTTGFKKDKKGKNGADRLFSLREVIKTYAQEGGNGNRSLNELTFHNFTDGDSYIVHLAPEAIKIERSVEQPLLYTYTITLIVIRDANVPPDREIVDPEIGNNTPSIGNKEESTTDKITKGMSINPKGTVGAYELAIEELKNKIGYGKG